MPAATAAGGPLHGIRFPAPSPGFLCRSARSRALVTWLVLLGWYESNRRSPATYGQSDAARRARSPFRPAERGGAGGDSDHLKIPYAPAPRRQAEVSRGPRTRYSIAASCG